MLGEIRDGLDADGGVARAHRTTVADAIADLATVGLDPPNGTEYAAVSADGYAFAEQARYPDFAGPACVLNVDACLKSSTSAFDTFRRFAHERRDCGDCLILALAGRSGSRGLEAFLPTTDPVDVRPGRWTPSAWPKDRTNDLLARAFPQPQTTTRADIATLLIRYSYASGDSPTCVGLSLSLRRACSSHIGRAARLDADSATDP